MQLNEKCSDIVNSLNDDIGYFLNMKMVVPEGTDLHLFIRKAKQVAEKIFKAYLAQFCVDVYRDELIDLYESCATIYGDLRRTNTRYLCTRLESLSASENIHLLTKKEAYEARKSANSIYNSVAYGLHLPWWELRNRRLKSFDSVDLARLNQRCIRRLKCAEDFLYVLMFSTGELYNTDLGLYSMAMDYSQHIAEQMLVAYLVNRGLSIRGNDLEVLRQDCAKIDKSFDSRSLMKHCAFLTTLVGANYPNYAKPVNATVVAHALHSLKIVYDLVALRLGS